MSDLRRKPYTGTVHIVYTTSQHVKRATLSLCAVVVLGIHAMALPSVAEADACDELQQERTRAYSAYEDRAAYLQEQEDSGRITASQRFKMDRASPEYKANADAIHAHEKCLSDAAAKASTTSKVVVGALLGSILLSAAAVVFALQRRRRKREVASNAEPLYVPSSDHPVRRVPSARGDIIDAEIVNDSLEADGTSRPISAPPSALPQKSTGIDP